MLVEPDPTWPQQYADAAAELVEVSRATWVVEHIGSTAVPGLPAKPVIDLAVRLAVPDDLDRLDPALGRRGWLAIGAGPRTHAVRVKHDGGRRTHIAHLFTADQWDLCHQRLFRDWLRQHPEDRDRYAAVKRAAAADGLVGRAYTAAKTTIVQDVVDRARAASGHPPVDVWDK